MHWKTLLLPAAAGAFLLTASCSKNKGPEDVTPETKPSAAAPVADSVNAATAAGAATVDSTAAMTDSTAGAMQNSADSLTQPMDTTMAPHDSM
ncbi:MAG TPA: hypothetical protein VJQ44_15230 [Gemmatimonadales bacterium]|nr:hypothetical protein [Gemmatimonadales bacterium]